MLYFVSNKIIMTNTTENLIKRLGLQDELTDKMIEEIITAIESLPRHLFATNSHTIYVRAIDELSEGNEDLITKAKVACNNRAFREPYELTKR